MMTTRDTSPEIDVLYQFSLSYRHADAQQLDDFVRRYPGYADALTTLAIELALESLCGTEDDASVESSPIDPQTAAMLSRAMSRFQNRMYALRKGQTPAASVSTGRDERRPRDLLGARSREEMQRLGERLDVSPLFLKRIRDREIRVDTLTDGFIHYFAEAIEEPKEDVSMYLAAKPQIPVHLHFKSEVTPTVRRQLTFVEAVRTSGLTPEQQARLLSL